ncbi:MAG: helix-turn-helix transcriptional regulator [Patescibacteria group bacterium]
MKTTKQLERYFKGAANHRRLEILLFVSGYEGATLDIISRELNCNFKTISEHTQRLVRAGLMNKKYRGRAVEHSLSPYGRSFVKFAKSF